jgi:hypothetical protein
LFDVSSEIQILRYLWFDAIQPSHLLHSPLRG